MIDQHLKSGQRTQSETHFRFYLVRVFFQNLNVGEPVPNARFEVVKFFFKIFLTRSVENGGYLFFVMLLAKHVKQGNSFYQDCEQNQFGEQNIRPYLYTYVYVTHPMPKHYYVVVLLLFISPSIRRNKIPMYCIIKSKARAQHSGWRSLKYFIERTGCLT